MMLGLVPFVTNPPVMWAPHGVPPLCRGPSHRVSEPVSRPQPPFLSSLQSEPCTFPSLLDGLLVRARPGLSGAHTLLVLLAFGECCVARGHEADAPLSAKCLAPPERQGLYLHLLDLLGEGEARCILQSCSI